MISSRLAARGRIPVGASLVVTIVLALLVSAGQAGATTYIGTTTYTSNTTWTLANSPYVLNGDVTVAAGVTLTVEPGVIVKMKWRADAAGQRHACVFRDEWVAHHLHLLAG